MRHLFVESDPAKPLCGTTENGALMGHADLAKDVAWATLHACPACVRVACPVRPPAQSAR